jgi:hypothetical protein
MIVEGGRSVRGSEVFISLHTLSPVRPFSACMNGDCILCLCSKFPAGWGSKLKTDNGVLYQTLVIPWKKENDGKKTQAHVTIPVKMVYTT